MVFAIDIAQKTVLVPTDIVNCLISIEKKKIVMQKGSQERVQEVVKTTNILHRSNNYLKTSLVKAQTL